MTLGCFGYFCIQIYIKSPFLNEVLDFRCSSVPFIDLACFVLSRNFGFTDFCDYKTLFMFMYF